MRIQTKRVYDAAKPADGTRILVDRLWPRGLTKVRARIDFWSKATAPSAELRKWYQHDPEKWSEFQRRYTAELRANPEGIAELRAHLGKGTVTLLFASHEAELNDATVLREFLTRK